MTNTDAIESLRTFAVSHGTAHVGTWEDAGDKVHLLQFAHLCTAALHGEEWAVERANEALRLIEGGRHGQFAPTDDWKRECIRATDTARPDAIARSIQI